MTDTTTTTPGLLAEAQRLEALIDEHAAEGDECGRLSDPVVDALHDAGLFGMWVPKALGGSELDPVSKGMSQYKLATAVAPSVRPIFLVSSVR